MPAKVPQSLRKLERFVVRPLFIFSTFVLILFAIAQASGRLTLGIAHLFVDELNRVLAVRDIRLEGLKGDWLGLNPIVRIERADFPAGVLRDVELELDVLESIFRSALVARRIGLSQGELHVERSGAGWRLRGMRDEGESFDVWPLLNHSDEIQGVVTIVLHGQNGEQESLVGRVALTNRGGVHKVSASVVNPLVEETGLHFAIERSEAVPGIKEAVDLAVADGRLSVPSLLTHMPDVDLVLHEARWRAFDEHGSGALHLEVVDVVPPGGNERLSASVAMKIMQSDAHWTALAENVSISSDDGRYVFAPIWASFRQDRTPEIPLAEVFREEEGPAFRLWLEEFDLTSFNRFALTAMGDWEPVGRWLEALDVRGRLSNVHAFFGDGQGFGYVGSVSDLAMDGYGGAPTLRNVQGALWGHPKGAVVQVNADEVDLGFPDLFSDTWRLDHVQGFVKAWFAPGYFALQGTDLKAELPDTSVTGAFSLSRPDPRYDQRVSLVLGGDELTLDNGRTFIPYKLPEGLLQWLERGPRAARLSDVLFAYHGQVHVRPNELARRIELMADVADGHVEYDPAWPEVRELRGSLHSAGVETRVWVDSARTVGVRLTDSSVILRDNGRFADVRISSRLEGEQGLGLVRNSPLRETMSFVAETWSAEGALDVSGNIRVPIQDEAPALAVDLEFIADAFTIDMPDYRIRLDDLDGSGAFSLPHYLTGQFTGSLFGEPVRVASRPDETWLHFDVGGVASEADVYRLIEYEDIGVMKGQFDFDATLHLAMSEALVTHLEVVTDLDGLTVTLPGHLAKAPEDIVPTELDVQFLPDYQSVRWLYKDTNGWVHADGEILRGAIGVGTTPPMTEQDESAIVISGTMAEVRLDDWVSEQGDAAIVLPLDWQITDLGIDAFYIDELLFADVRLKGEERGDDVWFGFASPDLTGEVALPGDDLMSIDLAHLRLPVAEAQVAMIKGIELELDEDPISIEVGRALPRAQVQVARLDLGDDPFGAWRVVIDPSEDEVLFSPFSADVNGVHITESRVVWDLARNVTSFEGAIDLDDLAETLPKWDYAPSLQTEEARLEVDSEWEGSPANVSLLGISGNVRFTGENGRFADVQTGQGGLRIMSLLNLSTVLSRIGGDFSDVRGSGITFKSLDAPVFLDRGLLEFRDRLVMDSTASNFEIGGRVHLGSGELDNELIVTLPVSESLPWYSAYLALANPLLGLGVLVGERVLRKPIEQLSSAKFKVTGTLDDPEVNWIGIWDKSMRELREPNGSNESGDGLVESGGK
jgi:uncharacterized protein YhdP